jgi:hypothetical protein
VAEDEGDAEAAALAAALASSEDTVDPLPWCRWAWRAWHALKDDRQWRGGGMGPAMPCNIPWTAVAEYADRHGHDEHDLFELIRAMDAVFGEWWAQEAEKAAEKKD